MFVRHLAETDRIGRGGGQTAQRDPRHPETSGNAGDFRGVADDRRHGLSDEDWPTDRRRTRGPCVAGEGEPADIAPSDRDVFGGSPRRQPCPHRGASASDEGRATPTSGYFAAWRWSCSGASRLSRSASRTNARLMVGLRPISKTFFWENGLWRHRFGAATRDFSRGRKVGIRQVGKPWGRNAGSEVGNAGVLRGSSAWREASNCIP